MKINYHGYELEAHFNKSGALYSAKRVRDGVFVIVGATNKKDKLRHHIQYLKSEVDAMKKSQNKN